MLPAAPFVNLSANAHAPAELAPSPGLLASGREAAFLDINFEDTPRPELITQLLALAAPRAADGGDDAPFWRWSVATRLKRLLGILAETCRLSALSLLRPCPQPNCGQLLELVLPIADLAQLHDESTDGALLQFPGTDASPVAFRRATGNDLRRWRDPTPTAEAILRSLLVTEGPGELPPPEACAAAFADFEALVAFEFTFHCPHCQREGNHTLDLEAIALQQLAQLQQRLIRENHRLALAYGWSESDLLQMPRRRRLRYLSLLEDTA